MKKFFATAGAVAVLALTASPAQAASQASASARVYRPLVLSSDQNLDFGVIVLSGIARDVGSYTVTYLVGGIPAAPPLAFTVFGAGTVPSFTPVVAELVATELPNLAP